MIRTLLLTRPREDSLSLAAALKEHGFSTLIAPMIDIEPHNFSDAPLTPHALAVTSKHALRAFAEQSDAREMPVFAVGPGTAAFARALGFTQVHVAQSSVESLIDLIRAHRSALTDDIIYLSGADIAQPLELLLQGYGIGCRRYVAYEAKAATSLDIDLGQIHGVLFFSRRSANIFMQLVGKRELSTLDAFVLSPPILEALPANRWRHRVSASAPTQEALVMTALNHYNR